MIRKGFVIRNAKNHNEFLDKYGRGWIDFKHCDIFPAKYDAEITLDLMPIDMEEGEIKEIETRLIE